MSLLFTNIDRLDACDHNGTLGPEAADGSRTCVRCGAVVRPESFTKPARPRSSPPQEDPMSTVTMTDVQSRIAAINERLLDLGRYL